MQNATVNIDQFLATGSQVTLEMQPVDGSTRNAAGEVVAVNDVGILLDQNGTQVFYIWSSIRLVRK